MKTLFAAVLLVAVGCGGAPPSREIVPTCDDTHAVCDDGSPACGEIWSVLADEASGRCGFVEVDAARFSGAVSCEGAPTCANETAPFCESVDIILDCAALIQECTEAGETTCRWSFEHGAMGDRI